MPANDPRADANPARVLSAISVASIAAGAINLAAATTIGRGSAEDMAFFVAVAAAQLGWGAIALARASRRWLALGAAGNLVVAATWVVSRTVGVPGVYGGVILPVGFPDSLATALEAVVVVGAAALLVRGRLAARPAARAPGVTVAAAVVAGVLAFGGVLGQAGVIGSSSTGNGGGVNAPASPGGGGGGSGSGSPGGGAYGY
ncbi:MAG TPA: hypothetical protein VH498_10035 [Candidatus Dormibacteraeota bacterium]|jgi:hypothetical protein|nr:hypothetical protein [Candidatus Dormibacteraeota bacterium]